MWKWGRQMKTCPHCGYSNLYTAGYCGRCHEALSAPDSAAQTTAQPPTEEPSEAPPEWIPVRPGPAQESPPLSRMSVRPQEPVPLPPPSFWTKKRQYLLGLGLGPVPVVLLLAGLDKVGCATDVHGLYLPPGGQSLMTAAGYLYAAQIVGGLICVFFNRIRSVGYGLLTMTLV